VITTKN